MQVPSVFLLHLAAHKALTASARGLQRARSIHAELVCTLSGSRHVGLHLLLSALCYRVSVLHNCFRWPLHLKEILLSLGTDR